MIDQSDRQSPIDESCDEKTKRCIKEFIKMVRKEIRELRFRSWHIFTLNKLENIKLAMDCIEEDLLGECSITGKGYEDCEDYMDYLDDGKTTLDFTQRIRDEIKKHNNIQARIEIMKTSFEDI